MDGAEWNNSLPPSAETLLNLHGDFSEMDHFKDAVRLCVHVIDWHKVQLGY